MSLIHTTIEQLFDEIAEAIRIQEGSSALIVADNFPKRIRGLSTSNTSDATATSSTILSGYTAYVNGTKITGNYVPLDTSDASANAAMIQSGETAYVNGVKITGTLPVTSSFSFPLTAYGPAAVSETPVAIVLSLNNPTRTIVEANSPIALQAALPSFGRVSEADVIAGQTFTSTAGLNKTGTFTIDTEISDQQDLIQQIQEALVGKSAGAGGVTLPTLSNPGAAEDLRLGKELIDANGAIVTGTAVIPGGVTYFPDGAFIPVTNFTDGKQYALVALIDGTYRYINTTTYNDYTMNATTATISTPTDDYMIFGDMPVMFTAVASGNGFLLKNGDNYLHGTTNGGTALRVGTTQAVWTIDTSATAGLADGKYYVKEDPNQVWLKSNDGSYDWFIKYETAGSFGYDRVGRDDTWSTGFVSFILLENVSGTEMADPVVDTSDGTAKAEDIAKDKIAYSKGKRIVGTASIGKTTTGVGSHMGTGYFATADANGTLKSVTLPSFFQEGAYTYALPYDGSQVIPITLTESSSGATSTENFPYIDLQTDLSKAQNFFIPSLVIGDDGSTYSIYGFRGSEGWTLYTNMDQTGFNSCFSPYELTCIYQENRFIYPCSYDNSIIDEGKIPLDGAAFFDLDELMFTSSMNNYNGIPCNPDIIITYTE